jgi:hypothetical protein
VQQLQPQQQPAAQHWTPAQALQSYHHALPAAPCLFLHLTVKMTRMPVLNSKHRYQTARRELHSLEGLRMRVTFQALHWPLDLHQYHQAGQLNKLQQAKSYPSPLHALQLALSPQWQHFVALLAPQPSLMATPAVSMGTRARTGAML